MAIRACLLRALPGAMHLILAQASKIICLAVVDSSGEEQNQTCP